MTEKISVDDAINEYYKLKDKYETSYYEKYIKPIIKAKNKSKREKRVEFSKLPKAECINCKRNVGSIFSTVDNIFNKTFIVKCGDIKDPCPLNINIMSSKHVTYENEILTQEKDINRLKVNIIKEKYNIMFGYTEEATGINNFTDMSNELKDDTLLIGIVIEKNILINDNPDKEELLKKSINIFGSDYILQFKQMVDRYNETGDTQVMNEAAKFYVKDMLPRLKEIQELKYEENFTEYDTENFEYKLYQRKNNLHNLEYTYDTDSKVISFVKGLKAPTKVVNKSQTLKVGKISSKNKTKKQLSFIIEGDDEEERSGNEYVPNSPAYVPTSPTNSTEYTIHGDTVIWEDQDYTNIWNGLSVKYKSVLIQDPEWMKKTIDEFVELRKLPANQNLSRDFVLPSDIMLPPNISESKVELDFGNPVLNNLVARLIPVQREIIIRALPKNENPTEEDFKPMLGIMRPMLKLLVDFRGSR